MTIALRRGDSRTLTLAELAEAAGATLDNHAVGDVLTFTLRKSFDAPVLITKTSSDGGITFVAAATTGSVIITDDDWAGVSVPTAWRDCPFDLQRVRAGDTTTLMVGAVTIRPDVSR